MNLVFVSGTSWHTFKKNGFRTRQGALLNEFSHTPKFDRLVIVTETGFRGEASYEEINAPGCVPITQVYIPGRLPESLTRPFGNMGFQSNYLLPSGNWLPKNNVMIWSYSAKLGLCLKHRAQSKFFYDVIDYRPADLNLTFWNRYLWRLELSLACRVADIIVCNGETARQRLSPQAKNGCELVRNGVDPNRFLYSRNNIARHGAGFVGVISRWIDFELLQNLLIALPEVDFIFFGVVHSNKERIETLQRRKNFHWLGEIAPQDIPAFLAKCALGILPYKNQITKISIGDSMKVFEYLAAGTPVVCTDFQDGLQEKFSGLIEICEDADKFISAVRSFANQQPNQDWQNRAWQFVLENTWQKRVEKIISINDLLTS